MTSTVNANDAIKEKILNLYPQADTNGDGVLSDAEEVVVSRRVLKRQIQALPRRPTLPSRPGEEFVVGPGQRPLRIIIDRQTVNRMSKGSRRTRWLTQIETRVLTERKRLMKTKLEQFLNDCHNTGVRHWLRRFSSALSWYQFDKGPTQGAFSVCGILTDNPVNTTRREFWLPAFRLFRKCRNDLR